VNTTESHPLVLRLQHGDTAALGPLIEQHLPGLRAYVRLRCGPALRARESASDIVQSACRDVLENLDRFQWNGEAGFKAWLYATALRKIADRAEHWGAQKRDAKRDVPLEVGRASREGDAPLGALYASIASPSAAAAGRETLEQLEAAFDRITEEQREVIVLARVVGLSHDEIGERLECNAATARQKLFRALSALSEALEAGGGSSAG